MKAVEENLVALVEAFLLNLNRAVLEVVQEVPSVEDSVEVQVVVDSEMVLRSAPVEVLLWCGFIEVVAVEPQEVQVDSTSEFEC